MNRRKCINGLRMLALVYTAASGCLPAAAQEKTLSYQEIKTNLLHTFSYRDTIQVTALLLAGDEQIPVSPDSAIALYQQALEESRRVSYTYGIAQALWKLGSIYSRINMYDKAAEALQESLIYAALSKEREKLLPYIYGSIGNMHLAQRQFEPAAKYLFFLASHAGKYQTPRQKAILYTNLSGIFALLPEPHQASALKQALHYNQQAEKYAWQSNDSFLLTTTLANQGHLYTLSKDWEKSTYYLNEAMKRSLQFGFRSIYHSILLTTGEMYIMRDMPRQALPYLIKLRDISGKSKTSEIQEAVLFGRAWYMLQEYTLAEKEIMRAREIADELDLSLPAIDALLADLYTARGQYAKALAVYRESVRIRDSIVARHNMENLHRLETQFRTIQKDNELSQKQLKINQQNRKLEQKNFLVTGSIAGTIILAILLLVLYRNYRNRQKFQQERIRSLQKEKEIDRLKAMMAGEEKERERIARELHDGIGGMLAAINMHFNVAEKKYNRFEEMRELRQIMQMLEGTAEEVRKTAHNLMPSILVRHNLTEALKLYITQISVDNRLHIDLHLPEKISIKEKNIELILFRMIQELIQNIIKHAHATHIIIDIEERPGHLTLTVEDNGVGFTQEENKNGFGLQNLQFRVKALQGTLRIDSEINSGTTVQIKFDMNKLNPVTTVAADAH